MAKMTSILISKEGLDILKKEKIQYQAKIGKEISMEEFLLARIKN